ncbi:MAG: HupE/UreJ family protein [Pseudomonadota bacterium]
MCRRLTLAGATCGAAALPDPAAAHLVGVEFGEFYAGALHLTLAPEHVAALLALALVAALQPREHARWILLALPVGLLIGAAAALVVPATTPLDPAIGASLIVPGLLGLAGTRLAVPALAVLALALGGLHAYANGLSVHEAPVDWRLYLAGIVSAGTVLGTLLVALATVVASHPEGQPRGWARIAERAVCSWIAAAGTIFTGLALSGV